MVAIFDIWPQVGGQTHLDLIPWYLKLALSGGLALAVVKATAAAVRRDKVRNPGTYRWIAVALAVIAAMGILTYYEHLHEPTDEDEGTTERVDLS